MPAMKYGYRVIDGSNGKYIAYTATRTNAHALAKSLGMPFAVLNTYTHRVSKAAEDEASSQ